MNFIYKVLKGEINVREKDFRARVVLIHKTGDKQNPANYRPIAVLNSEYKILTSIIADIINEKPRRLHDTETTIGPEKHMGYGTWPLMG